MMMHTNYCSICFAGSRDFFFKITVTFFLNSLRTLNSLSPWRINFVLIITNLNLLYPGTIPAKFGLIWLKIM